MDAVANFLILLAILFAPIVVVWAGMSLWVKRRDNKLLKYDKTDSPVGLSSVQYDSLSAQAAVGVGELDWRYVEGSNSHGTKGAKPAGVKKNRVRLVKKSKKTKTKKKS